jgi:hypothetical protein
VRDPTRQVGEFTNRSRSLIGMPGPSPSSRTAPGALARCVAVVAVLAALVLLPCADGMMMTGADQTTHGATSAMSVHAATTDGSPMMVQVNGGMPGHGDLGGVLTACLVFLVAVVATIVGLRPLGPHPVAELAIRGRTAICRAVRSRAPDLAQLCLLRT